MDNRTPRLPWEVLNAGDRPLATGTDVVFSRYQVGGVPAYVGGGSNGPLRILMVLSAPTDQDQLQLHEEANHLREELELILVRGSRQYHQNPQGSATATAHIGRNSSDLVTRKHHVCSGS